ncbi:SNF2-related protein [Micromonospora sp. WMMD1102]|uniref:DEAD/DEAH box helicase n=1 Tax=Micromonospora sp. WMMD1102 TaxID=3016105 RepID=UPI0024153228|nr:SNF2-related protein [Micromonospora sp. WMMD1102]MDG4787034.1 SNF2-related protein [Micromonospora sp. WMMD1102]
MRPKTTVEPAGRPLRPGDDAGNDAEQRWVAGCAVAFEPADPPRAGMLVFWRPDGDELPGGSGLPGDGRLPGDGGRPVDEPGRGGELTVVVPEGAGVRIRVVPARRLPVGEALPLLLATADRPVEPALAYWSAAARLALHLVARRRILPAVSPAGVDAWAVGALDAADADRIRELAAAMPTLARANPVPADPDSDPPAGPLLPDPAALLRGFLDAVADILPRSPAARHAAGTDTFAAMAPQSVPRLRGWAEEVRAGLDPGTRVSVRLEPVDGDLSRPGLRAVVQVHSLLDPALVADAAALWHGGAAGFGPRARLDATVAIRRAAGVWPPLGHLLDAAVPGELLLTDEEVGELVAGAAGRLAAAGMAVHWPRELVEGLTSRAVLGAVEEPPSDLPAFFGGDGLLRVDWQLTLGGRRLTAAELDVLAEAHRPVVRLRDRWVLVDPELAARARKPGLPPVGAIEALGAALTGTIELDGQTVPVDTTGWLDRLRRRIADPEPTGGEPDRDDEPDRGADPGQSGGRSRRGGPEPVGAPAGLAGTLRDYQLRGLRWLARMTELGLGGCLADDMGLGKTITLIALHLHRGADPATAGPTLVVCPASLLGNWEREIGRFAPGVPVRRFHGGRRSLDGVTGGFLLTTYGTMRRDVERLAGVRWGLVVADEAQHVKNRASGTARALRRIPSAARVALTGTPVENNLTELWAILDWTTPGLLGPLSRFRARWAAPVESGRDPAAARRLARLVAPFLLRRRKSDPGIAPELPPKTETDHAVALTGEQAGLYEAVVRETMARIRDSSGIARRGLVLELLTSLKQVCNHPAHYLRETRPRLAGRSGKLELLDELVDTILAEGGALLVFTQYVAMARLIERHMSDRGVPAQLLHGGTPVARRDEQVRRFQAGEVPVFLLSLRAAGTGLNLTRADHVVHYDRWWNPAVEEQATDRAYRIGQTRPVQVHRLVAEGTVEDRIAALLVVKRELADAVLSGGEAALTELSDAELASLVELRGPA